MEALIPFGVGQLYRVISDDMVKYVRKEGVNRGIPGAFNERKNIRCQKTIFHYMPIGNSSRVQGWNSGGGGSIAAVVVSSITMMSST